MPAPTMPALTVLLGPAGPAAGVLDVLTDLSAVGLVDRFLWVEATDVSPDGDIPCLKVEAGRRRPGAVVQDVIQEWEHDLVRLCVVVPAAAGTPDVPAATADRLRQALLYNRTVRSTSVRCVVARPGDHLPAGRFALSSWHNVLVAHEVGHGPANPRPLAASADPVGIGRVAAPAIAGILGLWSDVPDCQLDDVAPTDGARVGRSFYRRIDATAVEEDLRRRVLSIRPTVPRPWRESVAGGHLTDPAQACARAADSLWERHGHRLVGEQRAPAVEEQLERNVRTVLTWLGRFVGAAVRGLPATASEYVRTRASVAVARRTHELAFGSEDSAYVVVAGRMRKDGYPVGWREVGAESRLLADRLADDDDRPDPPAVLDQLWEEYTRSALTLVDGGSRAGAESFDDDGRPLVVPRVEDCVPGPAQDFAENEIPGVLRADVGIDRVSAGDVLGADLLDRRLAHAGRAEGRGLDAGQTRQALQTWRRRHGGTLAGRFGQILADQHEAARQRINRSLEALRDAEEEARRAQSPPSPAFVWLMRILVTLAVLGPLAGIGLGVTGTVPPRVAWLIAVLPPAVLLVVGGYTYLRQQVALFREINRRRVLLSAADAAALNLRQSVIDVRRLEVAYEQFLAWNRVLGSVLAAPFGSAEPAARRRDALGFGLPLNTKVAQAVVVDGPLNEIATELRRRLFTAGWLGDVWEQHLATAGRQLGDPDLARRPEDLTDLGGGTRGSYLDRFGVHLATAGTSAVAGDAGWRVLLAGLHADADRRGDMLLSRVESVENGERRSRSLEEFVAGVDRADVDTQRVAENHVTAAAVAEGRHRIVDSTVGSAVPGLSRIVVLTQFTAVRPAREFRLTAPAQAPEPVVEPEPEPVPEPVTRDRVDVPDSSDTF